jgi:hypothetical protein
MGRSEGRYLHASDWVLNIHLRLSLTFHIRTKLKMPMSRCALPLNNRISVGINLPYISRIGEIISDQSYENSELLVKNKRVVDMNVWDMGPLKPS